MQGPTTDQGTGQSLDANRLTLMRGRYGAQAAVASDRVIVWLNGTHGAGKTTTSALVQPLIPDSRVFDAEKVGEALMDITPGLPEMGNFQHWPPWRPLVVETARRVLDYTGAHW